MLPVPLPTSPGTSVLLFMFPGIFALAWLIAEYVLRRPLTALVVAPALAVGAWIELAHLAGYVSHSSTIGMWSSSMLLGFGGYLGATRRRPTSGYFRRLWRRRVVRWMLFSGIAVTAALAPIALATAFHDEVGPNGHLANISMIQNGPYPPRDLTFPVVELKYHYGFDLVCSMLSSILRVSVSTASDIVTISCWGYIWVLAWVLGMRLARRPAGLAGPITATLLAYGSGAAFYCPEQTAKLTDLGARLLPFCSIGGVGLNPPYVSYHFQHPWTVGLPLALAALLVFHTRARLWPKWGLLGVLLAALAICQFVLFAALAAVLPVATLLGERPPRWRGAAIAAVSVLAAVAVASRSGGFFAPASAAGMGLELHWGLTNPAAKSFAWAFHVFGLLLPLGVIGLVMMRRRGVVYALLVVGALVILNTVRYKLSWDIVKFATLASVALAIPSAAVFTRALTKTSSWLKLAAAAALLGTVATGFMFQITLLARPRGVPAMYLRTPPAIERNDAAAAGWLRKHMLPRTVMYRRKEKSRPYVVWAGLPQVWNDSLFPSTLDFAKSRDRLIRELPADPERWAAEGVRYFVLDGGDGAVGRAAEAWIAQGRAAERVRFGQLRIVELQ